MRYTLILLVSGILILGLSSLAEAYIITATVEFRDDDSQVFKVEKNGNRHPIHDGDILHTGDTIRVEKGEILVNYPDPYIDVFVKKIHRVQPGKRSAEIWLSVSRVFGDNGSAGEDVGRSNYKVTTSQTDVDVSYTPETETMNMILNSGAVRVTNFEEHPDTVIIETNNARVESSQLDVIVTYETEPEEATIIDVYTGNVKVKNTKTGEEKLVVKGQRAIIRNDEKPFLIFPDQLFGKRIAQNAISAVPHSAELPATSGVPIPGKDRLFPGMVGFTADIVERQP